MELALARLAAAISQAIHDVHSSAHHRFFVCGLALVVGHDKVRRDFATQRLRQLLELDLRVRCPAMSQKFFGSLQRNQFGGRPVHDLLFLFGRLARFRLGHLGHFRQRRRHIRFKIRFPFETRHLSEPAQFGRQPNQF